MQLSFYLTDPKGKGELKKEFTKNGTIVKNIAIISTKLVVWKKKNWLERIFLYSSIIKNNFLYKCIQHYSFNTF